MSLDLVIVSVVGSPLPRLITVMVRSPTFPPFTVETWVKKILLHLLGFQPA